MEAGISRRVDRLATVRRVAELRAAVARARAAGNRIALVPTMGALHEGHLALVRMARAHAGFVVASVFVNPKQFGANEDFDRYPRNEEADAALLASAGCDLLFAPGVGSVYPPGFATNVAVAGLSAPFEGAMRPGHFDGVATVVLKLLLMASPDIALFGEKDWQQLAVIRRLVADLDLPVAILGHPVVRDADGLALSSRNAYLGEADRARAAALPRALLAAKAALEAGASVEATLEQARGAILAGGFAAVDYLALVDPETLEPLPRLTQEGRLLAAARLGGVRLLDNWPVMPR
ncbi:MAG: pantoate--beta-alanine ligase [Sphingomonadaceae bacterium]